MSVTIDHVGIPAADPEAAGTFLAWVLGEGKVVLDGPPGDDSGDMFSLVLEGWSLPATGGLVPVMQRLGWIYPARTCCHTFT